MFGRPIALSALLFAVALSCGADGEIEAQRSYEIDLTVTDDEERYRYVTTDEVDVRVGDEVTFVMDNTGSLIHDLNVTDPDGTTIGRIEPQQPGARAAVTVLFTESGQHRLSCFVDDHFTTHEMSVVVVVGEAA